MPSADPGFDWIFTRDISGFVTQFGGANSHMAIRASELGIPAVIGAGEALFRRWQHGAQAVPRLHESEGPGHRMKEAATPRRVSVVPAYGGRRNWPDAA